MRVQCDHCKDAKHVNIDVPVQNPMHGKAIPCKYCLPDSYAVWFVAYRASREAYAQRQGYGSNE